MPKTTKAGLRWSSPGVNGLSQQLLNCCRPTEQRNRAFTDRLWGYEITADDCAKYHIDEETGKLMVYNHVFARWDALGERYWDEEQQAYVQTSGGSVDVEYATKHLRYENGGTQIWILRYGSWREYDPDSEYIVDMQEDWHTGALLVYNNDFERYEPFAEPFQPDGASYTVMNEFDMVSLMYDDGSMVYLENYGDGAFLSTEATGYGLIQMRGEESYYDSTNGFWWSYGWDNWSFSIDGGSTWTEAPSLEIRVVEDPAAESYVGIFDGREWTQVDGRLEFLDEDFPQVGWLGMDKFFYDLYDGVGYDGEPLRLCYQEVYEFEDDQVMDRWGHWPAAGHEAQDSNVLNGELDEVILNVYTQYTDEKVASFVVANPSTPSQGGYSVDEPLTIVFQADDAPGIAGTKNTKNDGWQHIRESIGKDVLYMAYSNTGYSLAELVDDLEAIHCVSGQEIENVAIVNHGELGCFWVGQDKIWPEVFYDGGFDQSFMTLEPIMTDDAQIQHYGCQVAGPNPYHRYANQDNLKVPGTMEHEAWMARRMLSTIAELTDATVFASSDRGHSVFVPDMCLKFGVDPDGWQVHYIHCDPKPWNLANLNVKISQQYQDKDQDGLYPAGNDFISTKGESVDEAHKRGDDRVGPWYAPLYWKGW